MQDALRAYEQVGRIEYHPTAEAAHWALCDTNARQGREPDAPWDVHVAYGPEVYGPLAVGHGAGTHRLAHSGRTFVLCWAVDPDPGRPIRVVQGHLSAALPDTTPWQVSAAISADYVVDLAAEQGLPFLVRLLEWKDGAHT